MSLQVWLPLNGNLNNQGLLPTTITEYGDMTISNSGKIGKCYTFDGNDDYLSLAGLNFSGLSEFSFSFWCKPLKNSLYGIFQIKSGGTAALQFATATSFTFRDSKHSSLTGVSFNTPVAGEWAHYTFVYNKGSWLVYKNGIQDGSGFTAIQEATFYQSSTTFFIGCRKVSSKNSYFSGDLNDFRIYNHALSKKEVQELAHGLILHYKLNNIENYSTIYDVSGYGNNGEKIGNIVSYNISPRYNTATYIQNINIENNATGLSYLKSNLTLNSPTQISVSFWIYLEDYYSVSGIFCTSSNRQATDYSVATFHHYDGYIRVHNNLGETVSLLMNNTILSKNQWNHCVIIYDGQNVKLYINNILKSSGSFTQVSTLNSFSNIFIGYSKAGGAYRKVIGKYSDFRVYCTVLDEDAIKELYQIPVSIDNQGNIFGKEFYEENNYNKVSVFKNGIIKNNKFSENNNSSVNLKNNEVKGGIIYEN